eukprot:2637485-Pyramimonas_sp.AAC.2
MRRLGGASSDQFVDRPRKPSTRGLDLAFYGTARVRHFYYSRDTAHLTAPEWTGQGALASLLRLHPVSHSNADAQDHIPANQIVKVGQSFHAGSVRGNRNCGMPRLD